jgi:hypothetical protein
VLDLSRAAGPAGDVVRHADRKLLSGEYTVGFFISAAPAYPVVRTAAAC